MTGEAKYNLKNISQVGYKVYKTYIQTETLAVNRDITPQMIYKLEDRICTKSNLALERLGCILCKAGLRIETFEIQNLEVLH